jgi:hypothetical protein
VSKFINHHTNTGVSPPAFGHQTGQQSPSSQLYQEHPPLPLEPERAIHAINNKKCKQWCEPDLISFGKRQVETEEGKCGVLVVAHQAVYPGGFPPDMIIRRRLSSGEQQRKKYHQKKHKLLNKLQYYK